MNAEQSEHVNIINSSAANLLNLINDILDLSKVEAGMIELSMERMHLPSLREEVTDLDMGLAIQKSLELDRAEHRAIVTREDKTPMLPAHRTRGALTDPLPLRGPMHIGTASPKNKSGEPGSPGGMNMQKSGGLGGMNMQKRGGLSDMDMEKRGGPGGMYMQQRGGPGMGSGAIWGSLPYFPSRCLDFKLDLNAQHLNRTASRRRHGYVSRTQLRKFEHLGGKNAAAFASVTHSRCGQAPVFACRLVPRSSAGSRPP